MDDVTRGAFGCGTLCFGIIAAAVGIRIYQSETLAAVVVGGGMVVAVLAAVAVVGVVAIRLYRVHRDTREERLIIARTAQALFASVPTADGGGARPAIDPAMMAAFMAALGEGQPGGALPDGGQAGGWTAVERPKLPAGGDS